MARPSNFPEIDSNDSQSTAPLSGNASDGFNENQQIANAVLNWLFQTIWLWLVYLDDIATTQFGVEHDVSTGVHTDVTADSVKAHAIYAEDDHLGTAGRVGAIVQSVARQSNTIAGSPGGSESIISRAIAANMLSDNSVVKIRGAIEHVAETSTPTVFAVDITVGGTSRVAVGFTLPSGSTGDWISVDVDFVYDDTTGNMQYYGKFRSSVSGVTTDARGVFAYSVSGAANWTLDVNYTGGLGLEYLAQCCTMEVHVR